MTKPARRNRSSAARLACAVLSATSRMPWDRPYCSAARSRRCPMPRPRSLGKTAMAFNANTLLASGFTITKPTGRPSRSAISVFDAVSTSMRAVARSACGSYSLNASPPSWRTNGASLVAAVRMARVASGAARTANFSVATPTWHACGKNVLAQAAHATRVVGRSLGQLTAAGAAGEPDRHHYRVLRLLHLRHRGGVGVPEVVLPVERSDLGDAAVAGHVRVGLLRAAHRLGAVRALRRSRLPQSDAGRGAAHDGPFDGLHRTFAELRVDRHRGAAAARAVSLRPGARPRRRMGRRRAAGDRERAARQRSAVRHVPAAR